MFLRKTKKEYWMYFIGVNRVTKEPIFDDPIGPMASWGEANRLGVSVGQKWTGTHWVETREVPRDKQRNNEPER